MNSQRLVISREQKWENFNTAFVSHINEANMLIRKHNKIANVKYNKKNSDTLITELNNKIKEFEEKIEPKLTALGNGKHSKKKHDEIIELKKLLIETLTQLYSAIGTQHEFAADYTKDNKFKTALIKKAYSSFEKSSDILANNSNILNIQESRHSIDMCLSRLAAQYNQLSTSPTDKIIHEISMIDQLAISSRQATNFEDKSRFLSEALELAEQNNNYRQQFFILLDQNEIFLKQYENDLRRDSNDLVMYYSRIFNPLVQAIEIHRNHNLGYNGTLKIYIDRLRKISLAISILSEEKFKFGKLELALSLCNYSLFLEKVICGPEKTMESLMLIDVLSRQVVVIQTAIDHKKNLEDQHEKKRQLMHDANQVYEKKFPEILADIKMLQPEPVNVTPKRAQYISSLNIHSSSSEEDTPQNDEEIDIEVTMNMFKDFNFQESLDLLNYSEDKLDPINEIQIRTMMAEFLWVEASKVNKHMTLAIAKLESAVSHLSKASSLMYKKLGNNQNKQDIMDCIDIPMLAIQNTLFILLGIQTKDREKREIQRNVARKDIILKFGRKFWYRQGPIKLSDEARQFQLSKGNYFKLQVLVKQIESIESTLKKWELSEFILEETKPVARVRSHSVSSFFLPREIIKRGFQQERRVYGDKLTMFKAKEFVRERRWSIDCDAAAKEVIVPKFVRNK